MVFQFNIFSRYLQGLRDPCCDRHTTLRPAGRQSETPGLGTESSRKNIFYIARAGKPEI